MKEVFLIGLGIIYLVFASVSDIKKREVPNWLNFSLIIFALGYRAFYSVLNYEYEFLFFGLIGFGIFYFLAYVFYYGRVFAGGDAKLLIGLGAVLPLSGNLLGNIYMLVIFVFLLLLVGSIYGLFYSFFLVFKCKNFKQEFKKEFHKHKFLFCLSLIFAAILFILIIAIPGFGEFFFYGFFIFPILVVLFPILIIYAKSIEKGCMIKNMDVKKLTIGDWLYEEVKIGKRTIKPNWEGLDEKEIELLQKNKKKVKIKEGIPFVPAFLFAFGLYLSEIYFFHFYL